MNKNFNSLLFPFLGQRTKIFLHGMRISMLLLTLGLASAYANTSNAQKFDIDLKEVPITTFFKEIQDQSDFVIIYRDEVVSGTKKVTVRANNVMLETILTDVLAPLSLEYKIINRQIIINRKGPSVDDTIKNTIRTLVQQTVNGTVKDSEGVPLPGANIVEKGTTNGVTVDFDGNFSLNISDVNAILEVSYIGFTTKEVEVNGQSTIDISLEESAEGLSEVVVVGYGTLKKRDITGSVGSLKMDETLKSRSVVEFGQAMSGKIAGVQVISGSGRPGTSSSIQIRGLNSISAGSSPLIVIDGVQLPEFDLNSINSSDIESIEVLKDAASASIYGSRGASGVILVTTKSGKIGDPVLNFSYTSSIQEVVKHMEVANASEYAQISIDAAQNGWISTGGDPNAPNTIQARGQYKYTWPLALENPESLDNTNFQDLIFRAAPMNKIDLSFSGGNEKSNFSVSGGYINQKGIVINSDYQKYSLNLNVETKIKDWLSVGGMLNTIYDHENEPYNRIVEWAVQYPSIYPVNGNDGYLGGPLTVDGFENYSGILFRPNNGHPLYRINDDIQHRRFTAIGNFFTKFNFNPDFSFTTTMNGFYKHVDDSNYNAGDHNLGDSFKTTANYTVGMNRTLSYTWGNLLTYNKRIKDHSINVIAGYEYNHREFYMDVARRNGYDNDNIHSLAVGKEIVQANDDANETNLISYLSRINYDYLGKYIVAASYRRDGSSRFGPNNKWGDFYSFSGAWRISEENFMKSIDKISNLKLRASYGVTGNDNFADYRWISKLTQDRTAIGNRLLLSYYPSNIENLNLGWEGTKQTNLGINLGLFKNRINIEGDYYSSRSDNLLLDVPIPSTTGYTSAFTNSGEVESKGFEVGIQTINISYEKFTWNTQLNFSLNRSKVLQLGRSDAPMIFGLSAAGGMQKINAIGETPFGFYGYKYDGVYMNQAEIDADPSSPDNVTPGDGRYKDVNGDGVLSTEDRSIIGNPEPDFIWGFTNSIVVGSLDFSFSFQGVVGGEIYDDNAHRSLFYHEGRNYLKEVNGRWRSEDDPGDGYHFKVSVDVNGLEKTPSSYWLSKQTYTRLKDVTLGYTFPKKLTSKIGMSHARLFFNGVNLFTIMDASIFDPESSRDSNVTSVINRGVNGSVYPPAKIYSLGLNVKF